jgi:hypothetical protein
MRRASPIDFALEGGAIDTDGAGTLLTTWQCLHERHPEVDRETLGARLAEWLAQDRVLWLDHGYLEGDDTDAHIDTLARFAPGDAIVFQACDDPSIRITQNCAQWARKSPALRTRDGAPYRLFPLPWAQPIVDGGRRLAASYANFLIVDGAVLMPAYGDPADARAAAVLEKAFPGRDVVQVPCRPLIWQNGSLTASRCNCRKDSSHDRRTTLPVALIQERNHGDAAANLAVIETRVAEAAKRGAQLVLLQELHNGPVLLPARIRPRIRPGGNDSRPEHRAPRRARETARRRAGQFAVRKARHGPVPQHRGGLRTRRQRRGQVPQDAHSRTIRVLREVLLHARRPRLRTRSTRPSAGSA